MNFYEIFYAQIFSSYKKYYRGTGICVPTNKPVVHSSEKTIAKTVVQN